jgi:hypothetical protein
MSSAIYLMNEVTNDKFCYNEFYAKGKLFQRG